MNNYISLIIFLPNTNNLQNFMQSVEAKYEIIFKTFFLV